MSSTSVNPSNGSNSQLGFPADANGRVQMQILNSNFEKVTLVKSFDATVADGVESVDDALSLLNGDTKKLVEILKAGIISAERSKVKAQDGGWFDKDAEVPYSGARLDGDKANALVLGLAKSSFSKVYAVDPTKAKEMAREFLKSPSGAPLIANLVVDSDSE